MLPDIGVLHPQIVHFAIALLFVGVILRLVSLLGKPAFASPAATTLILLGTAAAFLAVKSGDDAHGPAERIPGAREMVEHHEERGEWARNAFVVVAIIELIGLAVGRTKYHRAVLVTSGAVGLVGLVILTEAAAHGGDVVYSYAGGVGTRSGNPDDIARLLKAGLYHQAMRDRSEGHSESAARLVDEMVRRFPDDDEVRLLGAESLVRDRQDGPAALLALARVRVTPEQRRLYLRYGLLRADALAAAGFADSAQATLTGLLETFPENETIRQRLQELR